MGLLCEKRRTSTKINATKQRRANIDVMHNNKSEYEYATGNKAIETA